MTHKRLRLPLAFWLVACLAAASLFAQNYKSILGKWNMTSETDGDPVQWVLLLKDADGKLTASLVAGDNEIPAKDFSYSDGVIKFKAPYEDEFYDIELKADGDKLTGTWTGAGGSGRTTGIKN